MARPPGAPLADTSDPTIPTRGWHRGVKSVAGFAWGGIIAIPAVVKWLLVVGAAVLMLVLGLRQIGDKFVIEPISLPKDMMDKGYTPRGLASGLRDRLEERQRKVVWGLAQGGASDQVGMSVSSQAIQGSPTEKLYQLDGEEIEFEVPSTGVSLQSLADILRPWFGFDRHRITGEIQFAYDRSFICLSLQYDGHALEGERCAWATNPNVLLDSAATAVLEETHPHIWLLEQQASETSLEAAERIAEKLGKDAARRGAAPKSTEPFMIGVRFRLGQLAKSNESSARDLLHRIYSVLPGGAEMRSWRYLCESDIQRLHGRPEIAITLARKAIEIAPAASAPYVTLGVLLAAEGDLTGALEQYGKAISVDPNNSAAYNNRGFVRIRYFQRFGRKADLRRAKGDFDKAIRLNPTFAAAYVNRGSAYALSGEFILAAEDFSKALYLDDRPCLVYINRAGIDFDTGELDLAVADAARAVTNCKGNSSYASYAHVRLGSGKLARGDLVEAEEDYRQALAINAKNADARAYLSLILFLQQEYEAADVELARVLGDHSSLVRHAILWRYLTMKRRNVRYADEWLQEPDNRELFDSGDSWLKFARKMFLNELAPIELIRVARSHDASCEARYYVGQYYLLVNREDDAIWNFEQAGRCPSTLIEVAASKAELERLRSAGAGGGPQAP